MIAEDYKREKTAARAQEGGSLIEWAYEQAQRSESNAVRSVSAEMQDRYRERALNFAALGVALEALQSDRGELLRLVRAEHKAKAETGGGQCVCKWCKDDTPEDPHEHS